MNFRRQGRVLLAASMLFAVGCASTATSNTARTAKEQMLLSNAVDQSLDKVDFTPLYDQKVFIDQSYLECVDKPYVAGSIRHRVMRAGGLLATSADDADVIMEVRSGGVGTDTSESFLGTPEIALPGMLTVPEIRLAEKKSQYGYAKLGLVLFDAKSRKTLGDGGLAMAQSDDHNWYVAGMGPFQDGVLKADVERAQFRPRAMYNRRLPSIVAFGSKPDLKEGPFLQFASDSHVEQSSSE